LTFLEKETQLRTSRENALGSKYAIGNAVITAEDEKTFTEKYLFGEGSDSGIVNFLEAYYRGLFLICGRGTTAPSLTGGIGSSYSDWEERFALAVGSSGDDATGFYPPDGNGIGAKTLNESSIWVTNNGDDGVTSGGVASDISSLLTGISDTRTTRLIGTVNPFPPPTYIEPYIYGNSFSNKTAFLALISDLISSCTAARTYLVNSIRPLILEVENQTNTLFGEFNLYADYDPDLVAFDNYTSSMSSFLSTLGNYQSYFSGASGSEGDFDSQLTALETFLNNTTVVSSGISILESELNNGDTNTGLRKWLLFWISQNIGKPQSPYVSLNGLALAIVDATNKLANSNVALDTLYGDPTKFLLTPSPISAFFLQEFNDAGTLVSQGNKILWLPSLAVNKYRVYKKTLSAAPTDDDFVTPIDWVTEIDSQSGIISASYLDTDISPNTVFAYKIVSYDSTEGDASPISRKDSLNSSSEQSSIIKETKILTGSSTDGVVTFDTEHGLDKGSLIYITGANSGYFYITGKVSDTGIILDDSTFETSTISSVIILQSVIKTPNY